MKGRPQRLKAIETIIADHKLFSQDELLQHLEKSGFDVTQATLSRDLRQRHFEVGFIEDIRGIPVAGERLRRRSA